MGTTYTYEGCGHQVRDPLACVWEERSVTRLGTCDTCDRERRQSRIGHKIRFLRFGSVPESGRSTNHRDRTDEEGVSVYEIVKGKVEFVGWHFDFHGRRAFRGTGTIVGWGSDGEPTVRVETIRPIGRKEVERLTRTI